MRRHRIRKNPRRFAFGRSPAFAVDPDSGLSQTLTYAFAPANLAHLPGNMWVLWVCDKPPNHRLGTMG